MIAWQYKFVNSFSEKGWKSNVDPSNVLSQDPGFNK